MCIYVDANRCAPTSVAGLVRWATIEKTKATFNKTWSYWKVFYFWNKKKSLPTCPGQSRAERHGANELISSWRRRHGAQCRAEAGMKERRRRRRRRRAPHRYPLFSCCCFFLFSLCLSFLICCCCRRRRRLGAGTRRPFGSWPKSVPDSRTSPFVLHLLLLLLLLLLLKLSPLSFASNETVKKMAREGGWTRWTDGRNGLANKRTYPTKRRSPLARSRVRDGEWAGARRSSCCQETSLLPVQIWSLARPFAPLATASFLLLLSSFSLSFFPPTLLFPESTGREGRKEGRKEGTATA